MDSYGYIKVFEMLQLPKNMNYKYKKIKLENSEFEPMIHFRPNVLSKKVIFRCNFH